MPSLHSLAPAFVCPFAPPRLNPGSLNTIHIFNICYVLCIVHNNIIWIWQVIYNQLLTAIVVIQGTDLFQKIWDLVVDAPIIQPLTVVLKNNLSSIDRKGERGAGPSLLVGQSRCNNASETFRSKISHYASLLSVSQKLVTATGIEKASLRSHTHGCCQGVWEGCVELGRWWLEVGCHTVEGAGFRTRLVVERNVANVWKGQHAWVKEQESRKGLGRLTTHGCASCNSSPLLNHAWQPLITTGCEGLDECALAYSSALCIAGSMYHSKISPAGTALATHGHASSARCDCDQRVAVLSCLRHSEDRMS